MYMSDRALRVIEYVLCLFVRYCTNKVFPISKKKKIQSNVGSILFSRGEALWKD